MAKTMFVTQEGPANALALNKDYSQVVTAGRNVFKIFSIEDEFVEKCNLRVGKNLNLNFSCNDVAWNTIDDHILATAATNGAVVMWNLNRPSRSKQEHVFAEHKRTVNKVNFNPTEPSWLISGSQDGTMKTFDLRIKAVTNTFHTNTESVRDVQFSPRSPLSFASVSENGNVQTWDVRKTDKCVLQFTAHSGPVFACDWHPESPWLATASRDKTIKVWDMSGRPTLEQTINTIASVGRVKWRPQHKYHIASVALVVDCSINIWDIRRPYIPYASFTNHKDVATGIAWKGDPNICLTTSRDCTLFQHVFKDAVYPAKKLNPQALAFGPSGQIAFACRLNVSTKPTKLQGKFRRTTTSSDEFWQATSFMTVFTPEFDKEIENMVTCAKEYILCGLPLAEICDHNSEVARKLGRLAVSILWTMIKTLYASSAKVEKKLSKEEESIEELKEDFALSTRDRSNTVTSRTSALECRFIDDHDCEDDAVDETNSAETLEDFCFGDSEIDATRLELEINSLSLACQEWKLPAEAFAFKHGHADRSPSPDQINESPIPNKVCDFLGNVSRSKPNVWDHCKILTQTLWTHAENGDVQTPVCILTALGEKRTTLLDYIDPQVQETWVMAYLDLLSQHKLWTHSNLIIKLSWLNCVAEMNQQSTTVYTACGSCQKPLPQGSSKCEKEKCKASIVCSVCHQDVIGIFAWCQGCMHGGHFSHIKDWLKSNIMCPTGCGHACQYS